MRRRHRRPHGRHEVLSRRRHRRDLVRDELEALDAVAARPGGVQPAVVRRGGYVRPVRAPVGLRRRRRPRAPPRPVRRHGSTSKRRAPPSSLSNTSTACSRSAAASEAYATARAARTRGGRRAGRDRRVHQRTQRLYTVLVVADVRAQHEIAGRQGVRIPVEGRTDTSHPHRDWTQPLRVALRRRSGRFSGRSVSTTRTAPRAAHARPAMPVPLPSSTMRLSGTAPGATGARVRRAARRPSTRYRPLPNGSVPPRSAAPARAPAAVTRADGHRPARREALLEGHVGGVVPHFPPVR